MATNAFNELMAEARQVIAGATEATSTANGAAAVATSAAARANEAAGNAETATNAANAAALLAGTEADKLMHATVEAVTLDEDAPATLGIGEKDGNKHIVFGIPRGKSGAPGAKGDPGKSGVTFRLDGTKLYITREG